MCLNLLKKTHIFTKTALSQQIQRDLSFKQTYSNCFLNINPNYFYRRLKELRLTLRTMHILFLEGQRLWANIHRTFLWTKHQFPWLQTLRGSALTKARKGKTTRLKLPEVSLQFFLFKQGGHNRTHEDFIGDRSNDKVSKDTHRTDPARAAKQRNFIYLCLTFL